LLWNLGASTSGSLRTCRGLYRNYFTLPVVWYQRFGKTCYLSL